MSRLAFLTIGLLLAIAVPAPALADCAGYGASAAAQQRENVAKDCGFRGPRWHAGQDAHARFCQLVGEGAANNETAVRAGMLAKCRRAGGGAGGGGDNANQARRCEKSEVAEGTGPNNRDARDAARSQLGRVRAEMMNAGLTQCRYNELGCNRRGNERTCFLSVRCCERK